MGLLDRFRKPDTASTLRDDPNNALYVHLASDGGIFAIRGDTGEQLWVDREGLGVELRRLKERGGLLLYSRESGAEDPPPHVEETFRLILANEPSAIRLLEEPHPEALVPPDDRRTITHD